MNSKLSILTIMLLFAGLFSCLLVPVSADIEPTNNDINTAEVLAPGTAMPGTLNSSDNDYYKFTVVTAQNITLKIVFDSGTGTIYMDLFAPNKDRIGGTGSFAVGLTKYYNYTTSTATAGDYYAKVASSANAWYNITATMTMQNDAASGMDAGDADTTPYPLVNGTYRGYIADDDNYDYYSVVVTDAQIFTITFTTGTLFTDDLYADVFNPVKDRLFGSGSLNTGVSKTMNYTTSLTSAGTYYVKISGGDNDYALTILLSNQNDFGLGIDASDIDTALTMVTPNIAGGGWIGDKDVKDLYGFSVDSGKRIIVIFTAGTATTDDLYADIYNPTKDRMRGSGSLNPGISGTMAYTTSASNPGIYYVVVYGGTNTYGLKIDLVPQNDGGSTSDAADDFPGVTVTACAPCGGLIAGDDAKDFYAVNLTNGQMVTLNFTVGTSLGTDDLGLDLYNPAKDWLVGSGSVNPGVTGSTHYTTSFETAGLYYFRVSGGENDYNVTMTIADQDDGGSGFDVPESFDNAFPLDNGSYSGWLADADIVDSYKVMVLAGNVFTVNLTAGTGGTSSMTANIYDPARNSIKSLSSAPGIEATWSLPTDDAPTTSAYYYIKVQYGYGKDYVLDVNMPNVPPDVTPPVLAISSPSSGTLTSASTATIMGTAADDSGTVVLVEASLNGGPYVPCVGTVNWTTTVLLNDGSNSIMVRAKDLAGNEVANTITITFDGTPPSMNLTAPATRSVKGTAATIAGTASDNMGVESVEVMVNGGNWTNATGTTNWTVAVTLVSGPNTILVRVTDTAGNTAQVSYPITSEKDKTDKKSGSPGFEGAFMICAVVAGLAILARRRVD